MSRVYQLLFLIAFSWCWGQQQEDKTAQVAQLTQQITEATQTNRLTLLDSLCRLVRYEADFGYEAFVRQTVGEALRQDSVDLAGYHAGQLIFFLANRAGKPQAGKQYFDSIVQLQLPIKDPLIQARLYLNGGDSYFFGGETAGSIQHYETAGNFASQAGDTLLLGKSKTYMSDAFADTGKFAEAGQILTEAEILFETTRDTFNLLTTRNSRANLYSRIGFYKDAAIIRDEIVAMAEPRKDYRMLQSTLYNMSIDARAENDYKAGLEYLNDALHYAELGKLEGYKPKMLISILKTYAILDSIPQAEAVLTEINQNPERYQQGLDGFNFDVALTHLEYAKGNINSAIAMGERLFSSGSVKDFGNAEQVHQLMYNMYDEAGLDEKAYYHYKKFAQLRDSISDMQNVSALSYYQTLYETKRRDATIEAQEAEIDLLDVKNKVKTQWIILGGIGLLVIFALILYLRSRRVAHQKKKMLEGFSQELIKGQEQERTRLARELHDSVGQKLMLLSRQIKNHKQQREMSGLADSTLEEIRSISRGLHPSNLNKLGLTAALNSMINQADASTDILFAHDIDDIDSKVSPEVALHVFRIVQEAVSNMIKHSQTRSAEVTVEDKEDHVQIRIADQGKGFSFTEALHRGDSMGMRTLLERAKIINSKLLVTSEPNEGTVVQLTVPVA